MKRNVIVVSTNTQSRKDFKDVEVTTLADVKRLLDEAGIDYTNQAFYEGVSKAEYKSDDSILPTNMPFKGEVTNDLVFQLSNASKKISSGAVNPKRQECFDYIKEHNLYKGVKDRYGLIFTSVSTENLSRFISEYKRGEAVKKINKDVEDAVAQAKEFSNGYLLKQVISALTKMGYVVVEPKKQAVRLDESDIKDILDR